MATPPRPSPAEVDAAVTRIAARHARHHDQRRHEMGPTPREVLTYLRGRWLPTPEVAYDDIWDELVLDAALHWDELARRRALLTRARRLGVSLSELGAHLGIGSRQGVRDYLDRLTATLEAGSPDKELIRDQRRRARTRSADEQWLLQHQTEADAAIDRLLLQTDRLLPGNLRPGETALGDDAQDWLDELADDRRDGPATASTLALLGLALGELRTDPAVQALDRSHGVHRALRSCEQLRAQLAAATSTR